MLPLDVTTEYGKLVGYLVFFLVGAGFGASLEIAGFGDSRRLAAQFYFKNMTVLKTMFTGIIVACLLIFLSSAMGFLDFAQIAVNQTYLWSGIAGGLIMGVGFVIGGYCPGTSIISAASFKGDGIAFFGGTLIGAGLFGESVSYFYDFWNSSFTDRLLLSDWLGWSVGATVLGVTVMALFMFYGAEKTEEYFRIKGTESKMTWSIANRKYLVSAAVLLAAASLTWGIGQPSPEKKWQTMGARYEKLLSSRDVFIHPLEYVKTWNDSSVKLETLDLRPKDEFSKFHLNGAKNVQLSDLVETSFVSSLAALPAQGVVVIVAANEAMATQAWQWLKVQGVVNLYILDGGLESWLQLFSDKGSPTSETHQGHDSFDLTRPGIKILDQFPKDYFKSKIKLKTSKRSGGLCS